MSFTYIRDIPFASHNPSTDQPNMQTNTNSIDNLLQIDHVSFNDVTNSGKHLHVTFPTFQPDPILLNNQAQIYPKTFGSSPTYLETYTASSTSGGSQINGYLPFVKAMGRFTGVAGMYPQTLTNPIPDTIFANIDSITQTSVGSIEVKFLTKLPYDTYYVFVDSGTSNLLVAYSVVKTDVLFTFNIAGLPGWVGKTIGFMVI